RLTTVDFWLAGLARGAGVTVTLMLVSLVLVLTISSIGALRTFGLGVITGTEWRPNEREVFERKVNDDGEVEEKLVGKIPASFGALPAIYGTAMTSAIALIVAVPLSFGASLFLVRLAPRWLAVPASFLIEFLAAIPSIAYGLWGLLLFAPWLQNTIMPPLRNT